MPVAPTHPERYDSQYDQSGGRLAERHPNSYPVDAPAERAYHKALEAANRLRPWLDHRDGALPPEALEAVVRAYEALSELDFELPRVLGYVCCYELKSTVMMTIMSQPHYSDFSAHELREDAERWLVVWNERLPRPANDQVYGQWEIQYKPARVIDFRAAGLDPDRFIRR